MKACAGCNQGETEHMSPAWNKASAAPVLSNKFVDIWRSRLDLDRVAIESLYALLSDDEVVRVKQFKPERKRREYIITRGLLRRVLGNTLQCDPGSIRFVYAVHGKPELILQSRWPPVTFNVTHSHNQALIAVSLGRSMGIDVELIRDDVDFKALSRRFFSASEASQLDRLDNDLLPAAFFACWTRKEAFVKALGDGISYGLSEFTVSVDPAAAEVSLLLHRKPASTDSWRIISFRPAAGYIGAVAVTGNDFSLRCWT
jgi:4'-phosphopantetheinyl transferase